MNQHQNGDIRSSYQELFKQLLGKEVQGLDENLANICAEVAWQSLGHHTSLMLDRCAISDMREPPSFFPPIN